MSFNTNENNLMHNLLNKPKVSEDVNPKKQKSLISILITAVGNFSVQYNFQAISVALIVMSASVCTSNDEDCKDGNQEEWVTSTATATVFIGAIVGQLTMGYLGDVVGRTNAMTLTLSIVCLSAILSAVAPNGSPTSIYSVIIVARFLLGIGAGGIYPLSATKAAEDGGNGGQTVDITAAAFSFFWQVPGAMTPWLLSYIFTYTTMSANVQWRLLLGLGAVPSAFVVVCSLIEGKSNNYNNNNMKSTNTVVGYETQETKHVLRDMLNERETWINLLVTGGCWFIYDVAYYGLELFGGEILKSISNSDDDNVSDKSSVRYVSQQQLIALSTGIPACLLSIVYLKCRNIKELQVFGFLLIAFFFLLLAFLYAPLKHSNVDALFAVYCLLLFSLSFGPNLTTYILPAQIYPKEVRTTLNGISAACGKLGAFTGVYVFGPVAEATSYSTVMVFCAVISIGGAIISQIYIKSNVNDYSALPSDVNDNDSLNNKSTHDVTHSSTANILIQPC